MEVVEFFEPMRLPTKTHNELMPVRRGKGLGIIKTPELTEVEANWRAHLARHAPETPIAGPVAVTVRLLYGLPEGKGQFAPKTTKPDVDNVMKTLLDVMADLGFFGDDAKVASLAVTKAWGEPQGVYVKVERIEEGGSDDIQTC